MLLDELSVGGLGDGFEDVAEEADGEVGVFELADAFGVFVAVEKFVEVGGAVVEVGGGGIFEDGPPERLRGSRGRPEWWVLRLRRVMALGKMGRSSRSLTVSSRLRELFCTRLARRMAVKTLVREPISYRLRSLGGLVWPMCWVVVWPSW